jgi:hypothetical protein
VGLHGRPGVVGTLTTHRQAEVSRRSTAGDHEGPLIHPSLYSLASTATALAKIGNYSASGLQRLEA